MLLRLAGCVVVWSVLGCVTVQGDMPRAGEDPSPPVKVDWRQVKIGSAVRPLEAAPLTLRPHQDVVDHLNTQPQAAQVLSDARWLKPGLAALVTGVLVAPAVAAALATPALGLMLAQSFPSDMPTAHWTLGARVGGAVFFLACAALVGGALAATGAGLYAWARYLMVADLTRAATLAGGGRGAVPATVGDTGSTAIPPPESPPPSAPAAQPPPSAPAQVDKPATGEAPPAPAAEPAPAPAPAPSSPPSSPGTGPSP